jgi:hypothetical protein
MVLCGGVLKPEHRTGGADFAEPLARLSFSISGCFRRHCLQRQLNTATADVKNSNGTRCCRGDAVTLIKDLKVKAPPDPETRRGGEIILQQPDEGPGGSHGAENRFFEEAQRGTL